MNSTQIQKSHPRSLPFLARLLAYLRERDAEGSFLFLMACVVGLAMGLVSTAFRWMVLRSHDFFSPHSASPVSISQILPGDFGRGFQVLSPALGGLVIGLLIYKLLNLRGGHGVPSVMKAVATGKVNLPPSMAIKSASSPITITSGGSAGPEGPIVEIGAVIGSLIGAKAHVRKDQVGTLIGCGAAAGIAAVFNAPLGGVVFALELIMRDLQVRKFAPVVVSAVIASVTSATLLPNSPAFDQISPEILGTIQPTGFMLGQFVLLGLLCGVVAAGLVSALYRIGDFINGIKLPLWIKPAIGGLLVGLLALLRPEVLGEGNEFVNEQLLRESVFTEAAWTLSLTFLFICLLKIVATSFTLGTGGTGGVFAPSLMTGAFAGASLGVLMEELMPGTAPHFHIFTMAGMAGVVASALGIPLAATLIIFEIAGNEYELMLPLMITVAVSTLLTARMKKGSVYTVSLLRDGFDVEKSAAPRDPLLDIKIRDIMSESYVALKPDDNLSHILELLGETEDNAFVVQNAEGHLQGIISTNDLRAVVNLGEIGAVAFIAQDIADTNPPVLYPESTAARALEIFTSSDIEGIPIVESEVSRRVIGVVSRGAVLHAYHRVAAEHE